MGRERGRGWTILERDLVQCSGQWLQQSLSTSLDDPCFAFCNADQLSHRKVFTVHGLKNISIKNLLLFKFIDWNGSTKHETEMYMQHLSRAWIYSVTDTICLWMFKDQINVQLDFLPGCPGQWPLELAVATGWQTVSPRGLKPNWLLHRIASQPS